MPRDGSGVYAQPYPSVVSGTTIESAKYNGNVTDVAQDLNTPRPIVAGGTGATSGPAALVNLGGENAVQLVTNYDSFPFVNGSFYSAPGATSAPNGTDNFAGIAYFYGTSGHIEARSVAVGPNPTPKYVRTKNGGAWGAWAVQPGNSADLDAAYVNVTGDTMTGALTINAADPTLSLQNSGSGHGNFITGYRVNHPRWAMVMGDAAADTGGNVGSDFRIYRYNDSDTLVDAPFSLVRASGAAIFGSTLSASTATFTGDVTTYRSGAPTTGTIYFGNGNTKYIYHDGTQFNFGGGAIVSGTSVVAPNGFFISTAQNIGFYPDGSSNFVMRGAGYVFNNGAGSATYATLTSAQFSMTGSIVASAAILSQSGGITTQGWSGNASQGLIFWGNSGTKYTFWDGTVWNFQGGALAPTVGYINRQGANGAASTSSFNLYYNAGPCQLWIDVTNLGNITVSSDYRIKKDVIDLPGMWDAVKALRPIKYTQAQFSPPSHVEYVAQQKLQAATTHDIDGKAIAAPEYGPMFVADDVERWGFIAHELQETLTPSAATGVKDSPNEVQSPQWTTVVAALTKALQEAMARIEALEAR